jgi:hypothetical protein
MTYRLDRTTHQLACLHEAAHCVLLHVLGFKVLGASVVGEGEKFRHGAGCTIWIDYLGDDPEMLINKCVGLCGGYVAEMLALGVEFEAEDVIRFCDRDNGYEVGFAAHICDFMDDPDAYESVIHKTKEYLLSRPIISAVVSLADTLHQLGEIEPQHIAAALSH